MKFSKKLISLLLSIIIVMTNISICHSKANASVNRKNEKKLKSNTNKKPDLWEDDQLGNIEDLANKEDQEDSDDDDSISTSKVNAVTDDEVNTLWYILGFMSCMPYLGGLVFAVETLLDANESCKIKEAVVVYKEAILERHNKPIKTLDNLEKIQKNLVWKDDSLDIDKNDIYGSCVKIVKARKFQYDENLSYKQKYHLAFKAITKIKNEKISFSDFYDKAKWKLFNFGVDQEMRSLKQYFKDTFSHNVKSLKTVDDIKDELESNWGEVVDLHYDILRQNTEQAEINLNSLKLTRDIGVDCKALKDAKKIKELEVTYNECKPTFLDKLAGGWGILKYFGDCLTRRDLQKTNGKKMKLFDKFMTFLEQSVNIWTLAAVLSIFASTLANAVGLFVLKGLKIAFWSLRCVYAIIKAYKEDSKPQKVQKLISRFWGIAAGSALRAIYSGLAPWEKKK